MSDKGQRIDWIPDGNPTRPWKDLGSDHYAPVVSFAGDLVSTTGEYFRADGATTISYNADGTIAYIQIADGSSNYRQTWTWTSGNPTSITGWVKQ